MRRKDKEITDRDVIDSIIKESTVCRLGLSEENQPYIVPLSFGYDGSALFFHGALDGKKMDILKKNNNVCFELESDFSVVESAKACNWSIRYRSVIGFGKAHIVEGIDSRRRALDIIMKHYSEKSFESPEGSARKTAVIRVDIEEVSGKTSGY
ncbi:MAG: pyridoxamine 5'-phosphate oxidase family protein [Deltaproteobacteria bacterium]|nr:pyridoxamine 5'-phosphate oxidase family protein [Deltaproteobacteria bacterium]